MSTEHVPTPEGDGSPHPTTTVPSRSFDGQPVVRSSAGGTIPALGLGTWRLDDRTAERITTEALDLGYRHVDTAQMYDNEAGVGRAIRSSSVDRDEVFVTTKVANDRHEPDDLVASVEESLRALDMDHVDLLLVHWPTDFDRIGATAAAMANVHAGGLTRHIGLSNFTVEQLDQVREMAPFEVLQVECHPFLQQRELRDWCRRHGWVFTAYSPIAQGDVLDDDTLNDIAAAHDTGPTSVALAWLLAQGVSVIPRSGDPDHLAANWDALDVQLTDDDMARIEALDEGRRLVDPDGAPW